MHECTEGLICHALPFQDHDLILTAFTEKEGMVKFFLKKAFLRKEWKGALSPLTRVEFIYTQGKGELLSCRDISLLNLHLKLREKLQWLEAALEIVSALRIAFIAPYPAPLVYQLCVRYLEALPFIQDPFPAVSGFRLKILKHEGLFSFQNQFIFSEEEQKVVEQLAANRSLSALNAFALTPVLHKKILQFFNLSLGA